MIDAELQARMGQGIAAEQINVPDDERVQFVDGEDQQPTIEQLMAIRVQAGEEALTDDEYALLQLIEQQQPHDSAQDHYTNLAEHVDDIALKKIAQNVLDWVQWDEESRSDWYEQEKKGIRALGVTPAVDGGANFEGASTVVHPLLAEAIVQFHARALEQLWPAGGPVKSAIMGSTTPERTQQAQRVEQFLNYQYTEEIQGAFEQTDKMLIRLPLSGSCFIKPYYDPVDGICRGLVEPADFLVPYRADSLRTAPRYTERMLVTPNDLRKRQVAGMYRDVKLIRPNEDSGDTERETVIDEIRSAEGRDESDRSSDDQRHTLLECYCDLDLPGFEDVGQDGVATGIALPYVVTVDHDSQQVLSIFRNWRPTDPRRRRIVYHVHYRFMPGLGFYGYGLYHWIGGLAKAATGALRALMDSAQFANMQGGWRAKDAGLPNGDQPIAPGEWKETDVEADDLRKAFFPLPYKEPSVVLFNLLGYIEEIARRFAGTTEVMVGEGGQNVPVGTTLARIEQGGKVFTAIQKRLHEAAKEEYKLVAWLDSVWMPDEYPYAVEGEDRRAFKADFDARIDVVPVSDPNFVSNMQRYFMSEVVLGLAEKAPQLYDPYEVHKRALQALRVENIDALLPPRGKATKRYDPVTENALAMTGQPIKAYIEQAHDAHLIVHQQALMMLPQDHPAVPVITAHLHEHLALGYLLQMAQATGVPFQMPDGEAQEIPPEMENQIAMLAAQAAQQQLAAQQPQVDPEAQALQAEQARKDAVTQSDIARRDAAAAADVQRKDAVATAGIQLKTAETLAGMQARNKQQEVDLMRRQAEA